MNTQPWIVGAAFSAFVACAPWLASAQDATPLPASSPTAAKPGQAKPKAPAKKEEEEGPFAPKGKTGKLREQAEEEAPVEEPSVTETPKNGSAGVDAVLGFGKYGTLADPNKLFVASFVIAAKYMVTPNMQLGLLVPFSTGSITPAGESTSFNATAFGNVALSALYVVDHEEHTKIAIDAIIAAPTASGDAFGGTGPVRGYHVNQAVLRSRGFANDELFESNRFGFVPGAEIEYEHHWLRAKAFTHVPVLIQAGGQSPVVPPQGSGAPVSTINSVAVEWIVGGEAYANVLTGHLDLGLRAWGTVLFKEPIEEDLGPASGTPSKFQFVLEPSVLGRFGPIRTALGLIVPLGGQLGSDVQIFGLRLSAAYTF